MVVVSFGTIFSETMRMWKFARVDLSWWRKQECIHIRGRPTRFSFPIVLLWRSTPPLQIKIYKCEQTNKKCNLHVFVVHFDSFWRLNFCWDEFSSLVFHTPHYLRSSSVKLRDRWKQDHELTKQSFIIKTIETTQNYLSRQTVIVKGPPKNSVHQPRGCRACTFGIFAMCRTDTEM